MTRPVTPIRQLDSRLPTAGRIRIGKSTRRRDGGKKPQKIDTFRFTSPDKASIEQVSALYGGTIGSWEQQWEVISAAKHLRIALPPDPLGSTPFYELWDKGACIRRCDGETCELMSGAGPEGADPTDVSCICTQRGLRTCKVITRLSVILPDVRFLGIWRLDTGSWDAARELPGMVKAITMMEEQGLQRAELRLEKRMGPKGPKFIPVLGFDATVEELAAGTQRLVALPAGDIHPPNGLTQWAQKALEAPEADAEIVDAEIVEPIALSDYTPDADLVEAFKDGLTTTQQNKALQIARTWAEREGIEPPLSFDEVSPHAFDRLMAQGWPANG